MENEEFEIELEGLEFGIATTEVEFYFEETTESARILATLMVLDKPSLNGRLYRFEEAKQIAESLKGKPVFYGTVASGEHCNPLTKTCKDAEPIGFVESTKIFGNRIKGIIKITSQKITTKLLKGAKFLFSIGGHAIKETLKKIGDRIIHVLHGAKCNHLQIVDANVPVGFPEAELEQVLEFGETVLYVVEQEIEDETEEEETEEFEYEFEFEGLDYE